MHNHLLQFSYTPFFMHLPLNNSVINYDNRVVVLLEFFHSAQLVCHNLRLESIYKIGHWQAFSNLRFRPMSLVSKSLQDICHQIISQLWFLGIQWHARRLSRLSKWDFAPVCPDWVIYWTLGNFSKPLATIKLPKSSPFLDNFLKVSKSSIFLVKSFLGSFYRYLATFTGHTASHYNDAGSFKNHKNQEEPTAQVPKDGRELNVRTTILVETQGRYPSVTRY